MRDPFIPGGCVEPRAATDEGKENTNLGNPKLMLPYITVPAIWESFNAGKSGGRTGWPPEQLRLRFACPTAPPGTCSSWKPEAQSSSQGWKTAEEKPCIFSFRDLLQNMATLGSCHSPSDTARIAGFIFRGLIFGSVEHHNLP